MNKMNPKNLFLISKQRNNSGKKNNKSGYSKLINSIKKSKISLSDNNKSINGIFTVSNVSSDKSQNDLLKVDSGENKNNESEYITNGNNNYYKTFKKTESNNGKSSKNFLRRKRKHFLMDKKHLFITKKMYTKNIIYKKEGRWSYDEQIRFIEGLVKYGKNWNNLEEYISSRTSPQIRSHAQKFVKRIKSSKDFNLVFNGANIDNIADVVDFIKNKNLVFANNNELTINLLVALASRRTNLDKIRFIVKKSKSVQKNLRVKFLLTKKENKSVSNKEKIDNDIIKSKIDLNLKDKIGNKYNEANNLRNHDICQKTNDNSNTKKYERKNNIKLEYLFDEQNNVISLFNDDSINNY